MSISVEEIKEITKNIMLKKNCTMREIAKAIGLSDGMFSRCYNGKYPMKEIYFEKLKALLEGALNTNMKEPQANQTTALGLDSNVLISKLMDNLLTLPGRVDQLERQIQMAEQENGKIKFILDEYKKKVTLLEQEVIYLKNLKTQQTSQSTPH